MQNLKNLLERLLSHNIDFVLVGGFAGVVHGSTQVTQDIDICAAVTNQSIQKMREALRDLNPRHRMNSAFKPSFLDYPVDLKDTRNIYLETDFGVLDIMSELPPIGGFERIKSRSVSIDLFGYKARVISLDDLIAIKDVMGRPKDQQAARELKIIRSKKP